MHCLPYITINTFLKHSEKRVNQYNITFTLPTKHSALLHNLIKINAIMAAKRKEINYTPKSV